MMRLIETIKMENYEKGMENYGKEMKGMVKGEIMMMLIEIIRM